MKEVKRKNSQYRKARKISEEGFRSVLEEFEKQGVKRKTSQLWGGCVEKAWRRGVVSWQDLSLT